MRDFLSHLAINRHVSSSTQNQAFNALLFLFRYVLQIDLKDLSQTVRAKRGPKLPALLSVDEIRQLLSHLSGRDLLLAHIIYGTGMRVMEAARLRVNDVDFGGNAIFVRGGKGDKDRTTVLPQAIIKPLKEHLAGVREIHEKDLNKGMGEAYLPEALERKYPNAGKEWRWQYVFPANNLSVDPRSGKVRRHHVSADVIQKCCSFGGPGGRHSQACHGAYAASQLRNASSDERGEYPRGAGTFRTQECGDDDDLHAHAARHVPRPAKPAGYAAARNERTKTIE